MLIDKLTVKSVKSVQEAKTRITKAIFKKNIKFRGLTLPDLETY